MKTQKQLFADLVRNENPDSLQSIWEEMNVLEWQGAEKPFLGVGDVISIISRYLEGGLTKEQVEDWANLMEASDVALGGIGGTSAMDVINDLANPALEGALTPARAEKIIRDLSAGE